MKIGILGSGAVGQALATGFLKYGHEVMLGTRSSEKLADWQQKAGKAARVGTFSETAQFGDVVVLAVKGTAAEESLKQAGEKSFKGKIVIDATNPIAETPPEKGILKFFTSLDHSLMERLQAAFPNARFVKAFNSIGSGLMVNPDFGKQKPTMFICGNDDAAKKAVKGFLDVFGFETEDMGGVEAARAIEPLCILWCAPGFLKNDWTHAFRLLKK